MRTLLVSVIACFLALGMTAAAIAQEPLLHHLPKRHAGPAAGQQVELATQDPEDELQVRPRIVSYTGDGTGYLGGRASRPGHQDHGGLRWRSWKRGSAFATGFAWLNNCRPDCARGHFHPYRATVRVRRPQHAIFTRMTIKFRFHGHQTYDHRALQHAASSEYEGEYFPGYYYWGICGDRYTPAC